MHTIIFIKKPKKVENWMQLFSDDIYIVVSRDEFMQHYREYLAYMYIADTPFYTILDKGKQTEYNCKPISMKNKKYNEFLDEVYNLIKGK